ncbi:efflux RND transporter periplasmic adaptor subunit [Thiobacillus denitrificans]|uniref:efflux RND transporter periplasmic adaptor subunit n=1 Tax=Thiobacillus denitrificans TaxID=36861 RepID=UPI00036588F9|nr:efflux RND transporter periplasmic adaptor subunit [Thiobacillus denitrificans]
MRIERGGRNVGPSAWRKTWRQGICLLACGGIGVALAPLSQGHSDPRMFGQAAPAATAAPAAASVSEVMLPPNVKGREQSLFGLASVQTGAQVSAIKTYGLVVPNSRAMFDVNIAVSGQVAEVFVRVGDSVRKGQPIASVFNPEFITTQKGYLEFLKNEAKLQVLREEGRLPNYLKDAKENLRWWGMSDKQVADLIDNGKVVEHIMLEAPADGFITELFVQPGSLVNAGDKTMKQFVVVGRAVARMVAANASLWVEGYIYPDQRALLRPGLPVRIGLPDGRHLERPIAQVLPVVDPVTQRARFLVDLGRTPAGMAVGQTVDISLQLGSRPGTWVPRQAVLGQGISPAVYVQAEPGRYLRKPVVVLDETAELLQVQGVEAGEKVVVAGKMMLEGLHRISAGAGASAGDHGNDDHHH